MLRYMNYQKIKVEKGERWNFLGSKHKTDNTLAEKDQEAVNTNGCRLTARSN